MFGEIEKKHTKIELRYVPIHILEMSAKEYAKEYARIVSTCANNQITENKKALEIIKGRMKQIEDSIKILKQLNY